MVAQEFVYGGGGVCKRIQVRQHGQLDREVIRRGNPHRHFVKGETDAVQECL